MPDVQSEHDQRETAIDRVGIKNLRYPIVVRDRARGTQATVAMIEMCVDLPHHFRGTHMSRFPRGAQWPPPEHVLQSAWMPFSAR